MRLRYSEGTNELDISAAKEEFQNLAAKFSEDKIIFIGSRTNDNPAPYGIFVDYLIINIIPSQLLELSVSSDKELMISGSADRLTFFAEILLGFAEEFIPGEHEHIEYFDNHFYLSPTSAPLVLSMI